MAAYGDTYSRWVAWLKVVLPLTALALLSTLFLVSRTQDTKIAIPLAHGTIEEIAREQRIGNPSFSGVTDNGTSVNLTAERAIPMTGDQKGITVTNLQAVLETPSGDTIDARAPVGTFDSTLRLAELSGGVELTTSSGYLVKSDNLLADLKNNKIFTETQISAAGPLGSITAGKMVLQQQAGTGNSASYELVFTDGVNLVYKPQQ